MILTIGSLCSGIGGLDLGLERAGMTVRWQVEIDSYCRAVLAKHWPDVPRYADVKELDPRDLEPVDLICAGFPCQPVSVAGRQLAQADERWFWPEVARLVRYLRPRWVLLENVPGLLARGMGDVLGELAACGYDAEWDCVSAAAVGAPHLRERVWIVAYPQGQPGALRPAGAQRPGRPASGGEGDAAHPERDQLRDEPGRRNGQGRPGAPVAGDDGAAGALADPNGQGRDERTGTCRLGGVLAELANGGSVADADGQGQPQPEGPDRQEWGRPRNGSQPMADPDSAGRRPGSRLGWTRPTIERDGWWATEPDVGRVAHGIPARLDRLRALGNAVVPQVAEHIGRLIVAHEATKERTA